MAGLRLLGLIYFMKTKTITLTILICMCGCSPPRQKERYQQAMDDHTNIAFEAGVQAAINVKLHNPDIALEEWPKEARRVWISKFGTNYMRLREKY